jgi:outer membrane protein assembly factor BamA
MHVGLPIALAFAIYALPAPEDKNWLKTSRDWIKNALGQGQSREGFYAAFRGFPPGSGIAAGAGYRQGFFGGRARFDGSALAAWSRGTVAQARVELPHLASDQVTLGAQVKHQNFRRINFFGIGPESPKATHSVYALRNTDYLGFVTFRPRTWLTIAGQLGYSQPVTIGRPRATSHPATTDLFSSDTAPGVLAQPAFVHGDVSADVDTRNHPSRATTGGNYRVTVSAFSDRDYGRYSFRRYEGEASQFTSTFKERGVIAVRARMTVSDTSAGNRVPFYLLPALGGSRSLRGYSDYRFIDRHALLFNAEYRWRVHRAVDAAFFYDAGTVASRVDDLAFSRLKTSYGVGVRIISRTDTFLRLDIGRSREGTRLFLSLGEVFRPGHRSILVPFVP